MAMLKNYSLPSLLWLLPVAILIGFLRLAYLVLTRRFDECARPAGGMGVEHRASPRDDRSSRPGAIRSEGSRSPAATVHGIRRGAAAAMVRGCGADLRGAAGDRRAKTRMPPSAGGCAIEPPRSSVRTQSSSHRSWGRSWRAVACGASSARSRCTVVPCRRSRAPGMASSASLRPVTGPPDSAERSRRVPRSGRWAPFRGSRSAARPSRRSCCWPAGRSSPRSCSTARSARITGRPGAAVLGAVSYGLSATVLWAFSEGRIALLVALCVLPVILERLEVAFGPGRASGRAVEVHRRSRRHVRGRDGVHAGRGARGCGARRRAGPVRFLTPSWAGDRGRGVRRGRRAPLPVRADHGGRRRRGSRLPHRHHGPRGARPARGRRRAGDVVGSRVPSGRRRARVLARRDPSTAGSRIARWSR